MSFTEINANTGTGLSGTVVAGDILTLLFISVQTAADNTGLPVTITDAFPGNTYNLIPGLHNINVPCTVSGRFISYGLYVCPRAQASFTTSMPVPAAFTTASTVATHEYCGEFRSTIGIGAFQNNGLAIMLSQTANFALNAGNTATGIDELVIGATITTAAGAGGGPSFTSYLHRLNFQSTTSDWGWNDASVLGGTGVVTANVTPGTPVAPSFVQARASTNPSGTSFTLAFTSNNVAGNCIVVTVCTVTNLGPDLPTVTDSVGNTYNLIASNTSGVGCYVFAALNIGAGANTVSVTLASAEQCAINIHEFHNVATASATDGTASAHQFSSATSITGGPITTTNAPDLLFSFLVLDQTGQTVTAPTGYTEVSSATGNGCSTFGAWITESTTGAFSAQWTGFTPGGTQNATTVLVGLKGGTSTAPETMGMLFRLAALDFAGASASGSLAFNIRKAPHPVPPPEGRAMATVQIDATQITHTPLSARGLAYPEITFDNQVTPTNGWTAFAIAEFDLEHISNRGQGLSEVRGLIAVSRPMFQIDVVGNATDFPGSAGYPLGHGLALLTNISTLQTAVLGGAAMSWQQSLNSQGAPIETLHMAFPAGKGAMKYRLILLSDTYPLQGGGTTGIGKYTLQFTNYELPSTFISLGSWFGNQQ